MITRFLKIVLPVAAFFIYIQWCINGFVHAESEPVYVFFYSSETSINNFKSLKMEFDRYLSRFGNYRFQPFSDRVAFEKHITEKNKFISIISSWHYQKIRAAHNLIPVMVGVKDGKTDQRRVLISTSKYQMLNKIGNGPIASASSIPHTRSVLNEMIGAQLKTDAIRILNVPKDIDALMSVGFEMARYALVSEHALNNLKNLDPVLFKRIKTLAEGKSSPLLLLTVTESFKDEDKNLIHLLKEMKNDPEGANVIKMIGMDDWKEVDSSSVLSGGNNG